MHCGRQELLEGEELLRLEKGNMFFNPHLNIPSLFGYPSSSEARMSSALLAAGAQACDPSSVI